MLSGVTLLQFMERVSDRRAAEHVAYHLGWKYALELEVSYPGFHPTVLVYFRDRLEENPAQRLIFDGVVELLIEQGLIKRGGRQRIDSTHILMILNLRFVDRRITLLQGGFSAESIV